MGIQRRRNAWLAGALVLLAMLALAPAGHGAVRVWAVGDGGVEGPEDDDLAATVGAWGIDHLLYLGDVYETGTREEYAERYAPGWGRFRAITRPTPGNHEWDARSGGYDPYWGDLARGPGGTHHFGFDIGSWHLVSLNSEQDSSSGSRQVAWLRDHLDRYAGTCTIALWHRPRYSAGQYTEAPEVQPFWDALAGRATVVLNGHDHSYQRMHPVGGLTQFVVGTGGRLPLDPVDESNSGLAFSNDSRSSESRPGSRGGPGGGAVRLSTGGAFAAPPAPRDGPSLPAGGRGGARDGSAAACPAGPTALRRPPATRRAAGDRTRFGFGSGGEPRVVQLPPRCIVQVV